MQAIPCLHCSQQVVRPSGRQAVRRPSGRLPIACRPPDGLTA